MDNPYKAPQAELKLESRLDLSDGLAFPHLQPGDRWASASSWRRLGAYLIDGVMVAIVGSVLTLIVVLIVELADLPLLLLEWMPAQLLGFVLMVPVAVVFGLLESSGLQGSLGKRLLGLRVITVLGEDLDPATAIKRNMVKWMGLSFCSLLAFTVLGGKGTSLWDKVAHTRVVKRKTHSDG